MTKRYGAVTVLHEVDFDVRPGEVHALLGANGAGKSTLCKMIAGLTGVSGGSMSLDGQSYRPGDKQQAEAQGVQIVQQELNLIPTLSVAENLFLARLPRRFGVLRQSRLHHQAREALDRLQLDDIATHTPVGELGVGRMQMVEIAAALAASCRLLILDEPTAALSGKETDLLFQQIRRLRRDDVAMIYISHRLDEVKRIADRVTVLRDGRHAGTHDIADVSTDQMVELMGGHPLSSTRQSIRTAKLNATDPPALAVDSIRCGPVEDVSFTVRRGEIFGITGLVGAGRTELLRAIFGADRADGGTVSVNGGPPTRFHHPAEAVAAGLAMVTEDRKQTGLLLQQSIRDNITLNSLARDFSMFGFVRGQSEIESSGAMCDSLETRCSGVDQVVATLSGGNQQKVVIGKWLTRGAEVFLFDEPTRGIDVGARRLIYQLFDQLATLGKGIVIVSSDLDELFDTCDRIAVMSAGRMVNTFQRGQWNEEMILQACFSGHRDAMEAT